MSETRQITHVASGKVREIYAHGDDELIIVTTDRVSAYDVVFDQPVPDRGRVLTLITAFWMERLADLVPNHVVSVIRTSRDAHDAGLPESIGTHEELAGRTMIVRRGAMYPLECIVRGYLYGSAWRQYQATGSVPGLDLPAGMQIAEKLPQPMFSPSTKAETGHDELIDMEAARALCGDAADVMARTSVAIYERAAAHAAECGIVIADTKFEFGAVDGMLTLCDEALTPDSSRFWFADDVRPGVDPPAHDKQFLRKYLDSLDWDKTPPPPQLPAEVIDATRVRYIDVYERLTGSVFPW